jgi:hypothetical protein
MKTIDLFKEYCPTGAKDLYRHTRIYFQETVKTKLLYPSSFNLIDSLSFFFQWYRCLQPGITPLNRELPWISFAAIRFLQGYIRSYMHVFEYGSGGSTLFFARHAQEVISVEHDKIWGQALMRELSRYRYTNYQIRCIPADSRLTHTEGNLSNPLDYLSSDGCIYYNYAISITDYPENSFDIILIDGRARPSCFMLALARVKTGGIIVWDNTDRQHYFPAMRLAGKNFIMKDFPGSTCCAPFFTRTSIWIRQT